LIHSCRGLDRRQAWRFPILSSQRWSLVHPHRSCIIQKDATSKNGLSKSKVFERLSARSRIVLHADEALNEAAAVCLSDVAVPCTLAVGVAQAQVRIPEVIGESGELRRALRHLALNEARVARVRIAGYG
jgi:hypothetical protein